MHGICRRTKSPCLPIVVTELRDTGHFEDMEVDVDEDEHSLEMHLPYIYKVMEG